MRAIWFVIIKEFKQIFRDKGMLPLIFIMPVIQLLILANATTYEIKNIDFCVVDNSRTVNSRKLINKIEANKYFTFKYEFDNMKSAELALYKGKVDVIINIPQTFEKNIIRKIPGKIQFIINAIDNSSANIINSYLSQIIRDYEFRNIRNIKIKKTLNVEYSNWYNEKLNYKTFMVPGILVILVTIIGIFLSAMSLAKEKEIGTIEQLNVTPLKSYQLIAGKLIPILIIGLLELAMGLTVAVNIFDIPILGSISLIFLFAAVYLISTLGMGLLISTVTHTQQQAMFISWFFMVLFILLSGLFTPVESMPLWAQQITKFIPLKYFIEVIRSIMLKGSNLIQLIHQFIILICFAIFILTTAIKKYHKVN